MNFQQLRIIRETVRHRFNLTTVAGALHTSQSGVSKHIKDLEVELGVALYIRKGKRLLGLTEPGKEMVKIVERMLLDAGNIKNIADQYSQQDSGQLTIATTHTQARYILPKIVTAFKQRFPKVHLKLHQGSPTEITQMLLEGEADIGIATETLGDIADLVTFPFYSWHHALVVPREHPLSKMKQLSLQDIAAYPIITYHEGFTGRGLVEKTFKTADLIPDIIMSALDADVIKSYVELGLGVGIIASAAFSPERDTNLIRIDTAHLFAENQTKLAVRKGHLLRRYAYQFMQMCTPELDEAVISRHIFDD